LSVADLRTLCAETIRVRLDWDGLETAGGRVGTIVVSTIAELGGCYFPWYVVHGHGETTWEDARGVALRADDLATCWTDLRPARRQAVLDVAREFERSARPALIVLVAYRLPSGARLLLDGNHRVAALTMRPAPFRALVAEVEGPLDREILPDLARHGG
jgi:hypothetical protein